MSIFINLYYTGVNGAARRFAEEMESSGTAAAIRKEAGNLRYDYYCSIADPDTVLLVDAWRDQQALDLHHTSQMMSKVMKLRDKYDLHMKVERFQKDEDDTAPADQRYIRE